jgi:hypothetical protein
MMSDCCKLYTNKHTYIHIEGLINYFSHRLSFQSFITLILIHRLGILGDSEIVLSNRYGKTMVFINKTLSTETAYQQDLINRDLLSTSLIVDKVGSDLCCDKFNSTSDINFFFEKQKSSQISIV